MRTFFRGAAAIVATLISITGCGQSHLADDIDFELDFVTLDVSDELHTPYVVGAKVAISVVDTEQRGVRLESSDESVLRIDDQADGRANCTATGPGVASITARTATGDDLDEGQVMVMEPTHVELRSHGFQLVHMPQVDEAPLILAGGLATFEVVYFAGPIVLHGNGALGAAAEGVSATPKQTMLFERREWLQLQSDTAGTRSLRLTAGGKAIGEVPVEFVGPEAVDKVILFHELNALPEDDKDAVGKEITVLAQAFDSGARPIYGVQYSWDLDGDGQEGLGDLFRYVAQPGNEKVLGAQFNGVRGEMTVETSGGVVDSSNKLGCSTTPGRSSGGAWAALGLALIALCRPRRRAELSR